MRALSKLINENEPQLVLFVGEALVGNDGVNQLQMFNQVQYNSYCNRVSSSAFAFCGMGLRGQYLIKTFVSQDKQGTPNQVFVPGSWFLVRCFVACYLVPNTLPFLKIDNMDVENESSYKNVQHDWHLLPQPRPTVEQQSFHE